MQFCKKKAMKTFYMQVGKLEITIRRNRVMEGGIALTKLLV